MESAWRETSAARRPVRAGARGTARREGGPPNQTAIHTYGEVIHTFVDRSDYAGAYAPAIGASRTRRHRGTGQTLLEVDHCVGNVELGDVDRFVDFYREVLGFSQLIHYDDKVIHTEYSALMSKVMQNGNGRIKFPINEPAAGKKKSQIQEFLDYYLEARHPAHCAAHHRHRGHGASPPRTRHRVPRATAGTRRAARAGGDVGEPMDTLEELGIEADRDEEGYLLQIFTKPVQDRPTFFFEIIERHGSRGFGVGNFKALFEAIEREQEKRGNLSPRGGLSCQLAAAGSIGPCSSRSSRYARPRSGFGERRSAPAAVGRRRVAQARKPATGGSIQNPGRLNRAFHVEPMPSAGRGSSRTRAATTRRPWPAAPGCSGFTPSSSCPRTPRRSRSIGSGPTAPS